MSQDKCDKIQSVTLLNNEKKENLEEKINNKDDEEQSISMCWTKVPGMGLICIIIKNILGGVSDAVAKKIENIGNFLSIHVQCSLFINPCLIPRLCEFDILQKSNNVGNNNVMEHNQGKFRIHLPTNLLPYTQDQPPFPSGLPLRDRILQVVR